MPHENRLKKRLADGKPALACWLHLSSPIATEIIALAGYDALVIDHEHGPGDFLNAISLMQAASRSGASIILRVPWNDMVYVKRALDSGADGIMFPSIQNADEARAAVAACRYPPEGVRGFANQIARCADYGVRAEEYLASGPERLFVMCQIESRVAVENIPEIAAVEGVDMLFIGPSDLAASIGRAGQVDDPQVADLIAEAESRIKRSGKWLGAIPLPGRDANALFADGYDLVIASSDVTLLGKAAAAEVAACAGEPE